MNYREQLKDDRWKLKRQKILNYADHRCQTCGIEGASLQVHHSYYIDGAKAWEYPDGSLVTLCDDCHGRVIHGIRKYNDWAEGKGEWFLEKATSNMLCVCASLEAARAVAREAHLDSSFSEYLECLCGPIAQALVIYRTAIAIIKNESHWPYPVEFENDLNKSPENARDIISQMERQYLGANFFMAPEKATP